MYLETSFLIFIFLDWSWSTQRSFLLTNHDVTGRCFKMDQQPSWLDEEEKKNDLLSTPTFPLMEASFVEDAGNVLIFVTVVILDASMLYSWAEHCGSVCRVRSQRPKNCWKTFGLNSFPHFSSGYGAEKQGSQNNSWIFLNCYGGNRWDIMRVMSFLWFLLLLYLLSSDEH